MIKKIIFNRYLIALGMILTFYSSSFSQIENYSVPAKWENYSVKNRNVTVLLPRLPVLIEQGNNCHGETTQNYAAYNDGVVYILRVTSKVKTPETCFTVRVSDAKKFDEKSFQERVQFLKKDLSEAGDLEKNAMKNETIKLIGNKKLTKLINDYENRRWFELSVAGADENKDEVRNFLASLKIEKNTTGIEIGDGAERVFGDDASKNMFEVKDEKANAGIGNTEKIEDVKKMLFKINDTEAKGAMIVLKERAKYTDSARQNRIQGGVVLRVTFQANGAIGAISVISGLTQGLTEEAIKAARKIVFIPPQKDGFRYSITRAVEYSFTVH